MDNKYSTEFRTSQNPLLVILLLVITVFFGFIFGTLIQDFFLRTFLDTSLSEMASSKNTVSLIIIQGITSFFTFILAPVLYAKYWINLGFKELFVGKLDSRLLLITMGLVILVIPLINFIMEWNGDIKFPSSLSGIESQLQSWESKAAELTTIFLDFKSPLILLLVVTVVGFIPAVGEELLFRGLIQRILLKTSKHIGLSIFLVAVLFSAIHFQFYGFFPRLILGLLLGLIYYWSGNLIYSIVFHFLNNSLTVILFYMHNVGVIEVNIMDNPTLPYLTVIFSFMVTLVSLLYFRRISLKELSINK